MCAALARLAGDGTGGTRLLILTGPGGSGKTRLALEVAHRIAPAWPDGVVWVELAPVREPGRVPGAVAAALGLVEQPQRDAAAAVADACAARTTLLVLDNCEHLVAPCAALVAGLLARCPALAVLATSREPLAVAGEVTQPVPPLAVPAVESLRATPHAAAVAAVASSPAAALFVERARAALPSFALTADNAADVAAVCRRLDGLPLAIELAAARVRALTPRQIAARLDDALRLLRAGRRDVPARQQTLEAAIAWSDALLTPPERALFRRLAVFRGGWTLDAAEAVGAAPLGAEAPGAAAPNDVGARGGGVDAVAVLVRLVEKSLVVVHESGGEARYALLEPVRQYAARRLADAGETDAAERAHAAYLVRLAEQAAPALGGALGGAARATWAPQLLAEHENVRAALAWAAARAPDSPDAAFGARLVAALAPLWVATTRWQDGHAWAAAALPAAVHAGGGLRAAVLVAAGALGWMRGDPAAPARLDAGIAAARALGDAPLLVLALTQRGQAAAAAGDRAAARAALDEALAAARAYHTAAVGGAPWLVGVALTAALLGYGWSGTDADEAARALAVQREAEAVWEAAGERWALAVVRNCGSGLACARGDARAAAAHARSALDALLPEPAPYDLAQVLAAMARAAVLGGDPARAAWLLGAEATQRDRAGAGVLPTQRGPRAALAAAVRSALGADAYGRATADGALAPLDAVLARALEFPGAAGDEAWGGTMGRGPNELRAVAQSAPVQSAPVLRIRALGPLVVERDGRALAAADWGFARPRELLAYLLCYPDGRTKAQIGLALWPEASAAQFRGGFHVAVHHLRRALGDPRWVTYAGGRYALSHAGPAGVGADDAIVDIDVERFLAAATAADTARREAARARAGCVDAEGVAASLAAHHAALALYRGEFFEGEPLGPWADAERAALRLRYHALLLALGELQLAAGLTVDALATYRRGVGDDPLWEAAHRGVVRALARTGHRAEALRHYGALTALLREELGARPDPTTEALRRAVQDGTDA